MKEEQDRIVALAGELRSEARRLLDRLGSTEDRIARRQLASRAFALVQEAEELQPFGSLMPEGKGALGARRQRVA